MQPSSKKNPLKQQQPAAPNPPVYYAPSNQPQQYHRHSQQQVAPSPYYGHSQQPPYFPMAPPSYGYTSSSAIVTLAHPMPIGLPMASPPPSYLAWSIVNLILGILFSWIGMFIAIPAIIASQEVTKYSQYGDAIGARRNSSSAQSYNIASTIFNCIGILVFSLVMWQISYLFYSY